MSESLTALVAVRSGSLRVNNKNLRPFAGSSLLEVKVRQLMRIPGLDQVCVNSNDDEMLEIARSAGALAIKRDPYFASNTVSMSEVYKDMASKLDCEHLLFATVTSPLVADQSYADAIQLYRNLPEGYDSITSVQEVKEFLYLNGKPLNYDPENTPRSQDLPEIDKLTFAISILPRQEMINRGNCVGASPFFLRLNQFESLDIDTPFDFAVANVLYEKVYLNKEPLPA